ncbi:MAG: glutamine--fructose-6-phosphate transaminase (isomerizing), partial [Microgenomates group bacterium]
LTRLDYRGYDSWGVASMAQENGGAPLSAQHFFVEKDKGMVPASDQIEAPKSYVAIGHTRWATHGSVTKNNAHPHLSSEGSFALAQNGIVGNFVELKKELITKGYRFTTQTDTEVIVRLVEEMIKKGGSLVEAVRRAFTKIEGRNTVIVLAKDGSIITARNGSPMVIGLDFGKSGAGKKNPELSSLENIYFSSDTLSFAGAATHILVLDNGQMAVCAGAELEITSIKSGKKAKVEPVLSTMVAEEVNKEGFDHFMVKEIHETPSTLKAVIQQEKEEFNNLVVAVKKAKNVYTLGSGTAGIAAAQIAYYLRSIAQVQTISLIGAESDSYFNLFKKGDLIIAPSQSGETADVLEVLEIAKEKGVKIATLVNMQGSMMSRMSDYPFMAKAGPEMCVMSTKVFVAQIAFGYYLAHAVAGNAEKGEKNIESVAEKIETYLADSAQLEKISDVASSLVKVNDIFLLGKSQNVSIVQEGMVKLIEGSYKHAHGIPAGDLKHYAITILEKGVPVIFALSNDSVLSDVMNAAHEVKARGATVIGIGYCKDQQGVFDTTIPLPDTGDTSGIFNVVVLQLLAYFLTVKLGNNVDKPRNIAKSVTVK